MHRYHLHVRLAGRDIVQFDGSSLKDAKRTALALAADYMRTYARQDRLQTQSFQVVDDAGRLLIEWSMPDVMRELADPHEGQTPGEDATSQLNPG